MKTLLGLVTAGLVVACWFGPVASAADADKAGGWIKLFDGKTLDGWKASEDTDAFKVEDGTIVANAQGNSKKRSHLFYTAAKEPFKNFEFEIEVKTEPGSNSGLYFHTKPQDTGWPSKGYEAQVNNTFPPDPRRTGSLYGIEDIKDPPVKDNEWFKYSIKVDGKRIILKLNDKVVVDYTEPEVPKTASTGRDRKLDEGTFALQSHPDSSKVYYRNLRARRLP